MNYYDYENSNNINNYSFLKFLKFDLKRKIKASDISWESEEFDINDPKFSSEDENYHEESEKDENEEGEDSEVFYNEKNNDLIDNDIDFNCLANKNFDAGRNCTEEKNLIATFENIKLNNFNYLKSENNNFNRNKNPDDLYYNTNSNKDLISIGTNNVKKNNNDYDDNKLSPAYANKKNIDIILVNKQTKEIKTKNNELNKEINKSIKIKKSKEKTEKIDFSEILAEINRLKFSSDLSQNNLNFNNNSKNDKININEELNFSNNCFPYRTMVYSSELLSSENISLMQNVSEINHENNFSSNNKKQDLDNIDNSDRNINLNDYSFSRINSVNHSYNISSFMKKASNQTIETINRNSKNGFYSK